MHWIKRVVTPPFVVLAALLLWVEEWLWELVKVLAAIIAHLPPLRWYEAAIVRLPPYATLVAFLVPGALLFPVKLGALWLVSHHHAVLGVAVIIAAKVLGTTIVARSFVLAKPKLMTIAWFARLYEGFISLRNRVYDAVKAIPLFQRTRAALHRMRVKLSEVIAARFAKMPGGGRLTRRWQAVKRRAAQRRHHGATKPELDPMHPKD